MTELNGTAPFNGNQPLLNAAIRDIPLPPRMASLPVNKRGFVVPWFVSFRNDDWDFVNVDPNKIGIAYNHQLCWLCGQKLGQYKTNLVGPMCGINRTTSEPAQHKACSEFAARACPFLVNPNARRNDKATEMPGNVPGIHLAHNPGVSLVWTSKTLTPFRAHGGVLFELGEPTEISWWHRGRKATRAEVDASIAKGLPKLQQMAALEGREAMRDLNKMIERAAKLLPAE